MVLLHTREAMELCYLLKMLRLPRAPLQHHLQLPRQPLPSIFLSSNTQRVDGELGLSKSPCEGVKWLKHSWEHTTAEFPHTLHKLTLLQKCGIDNIVFVDCKYATKLLAQVSELSNTPSTYCLGECYKYGKMGCLQDPTLSIHYYMCPRPSRAVSPP